MDKSEKGIDELIHQALSKEEAEYFDQLGEQNLPQMLTGLYKGKNSWLNILITVIHLVIFGLTVYSLINFLDAEVVEEKMEYQTWVLLGFMTMVLFKIWSWNQIDKNAIKREIKRLELRISLLKNK